MTTTARAHNVLPAHIGVIMDGNRRWARAAGMARVSAGHRAGADHRADLLRWLTVRGIQHASVYVLSADNVRKRDADEVAHLFRLVEELVPAWLGRSDEWQLHRR